MSKRENQTASKEWDHDEYMDRLDQEVRKLLKSGKTSDGELVSDANAFYNTNKGAIGCSKNDYIKDLKQRVRYAQASSHRQRDNHMGE